MKYGYNGASERELIANYKIVDDKIVILYLDGYAEKIPYTKSNEDIIIAKMITQAEVRRDSEAERISNTNMKKALTVGLGSGAVTLASLGLTQFGEYISIFFGPIALYNLIYMLQQNANIKELKKYDIYLKIREEIEKYQNNPSLYNNVKTRNNSLNINTLDNYSLKDLRVIKANLEQFSTKEKVLSK